MTNRTIDLTESQIKRRIYETALNELDWRTYGNAAAKRIAQSKEERKLAKKSLAGKKKDKEAWKQHTLLSRKRYRQAQKLGKMAQDTLNKQAEKGEKFVMSPLVADDEFPRGRYARITDNSGKKPSGKSSAVAQAHNFFSGKSEYDKDKSVWESIKRAVTENVVRALAQTETGRRLTENTDRVDKRQVIAPIIETVNRLVEGVRRMVCEADNDAMREVKRIHDANRYPTEEESDYLNNLLQGCTLFIRKWTYSPPTYKIYSDLEGGLDKWGEYHLYGIDQTNPEKPRVAVDIAVWMLCNLLLGDRRGIEEYYLAHNEQEREDILQSVQAWWKEAYESWEARQPKMPANLEDFDFNKIPISLAERIEEEAGKCTDHCSTTVEDEWEFEDGSSIIASAEVEFYPEETYYNAGDWDTEPESGGYTSITIADYGVSIVDESRDGYEYTEDDIKALNIDWSPLDKLDEIRW